jgi:UDP-N-acetylglucosamine 2-epimerase (non-hydrolysing)
MKIATVFGTRPEAIKMAPVVLELRRRAAAMTGLKPTVYVTAQHRELLDQVLGLFDITPDVDLDLMRANQELPELTARMLTSLSLAFKHDKPDLVLVHGDTTTSMVAALAAFYQQIPVGHVEAGLRTWQRYSPFPEEMNRRIVDHLATYHFAPTPRAAANLRAEGIAETGLVQTGNTVVDALLWMLERSGPEAGARLLKRYPALQPMLAGKRRMLLVTSHRRESFGKGLSEIFHAFLDLTQTFPDIDIVYPVHPNPHVRDCAERVLAGRPHIHLLEPLEYQEFGYLMNCCYFILTDSGGIQEEAPALHKPVLVLRDTSERPEGIEAGTARVVGTQRRNIVAAASRLLTDPAEFQRMATAPNPYGDGRAAVRIVDFLCEQLALEKAG